MRASEKNLNVGMNDIHSPSRPSPASDTSESRRFGAEQSRPNHIPHHHDVPLDANGALLGPRFAWGDVDAKAGLTRFLRRRSSASSATGGGTPDHPVKIKGSMPSPERFWRELVYPVSRTILTFLWIGFVLVSCAFVAVLLSPTRRVIVAVAAICVYVVFYVIVWQVLAPISSGTLKAKLWFSHKPMKKLEHQFDYELLKHERRRAHIQKRRLKMSCSSVQPIGPSTETPTMPSMLAGSRLSTPQSGVYTPVPHTISRLAVKRTQSTLGALPMLVWSAQTNVSPTNFSPEIRGGTYVSDPTAEERSHSQLLPPGSRFKPTGRSNPLGGRAVTNTQDILQAISQPDMGLLERRNVQFQNPVAGRRLPQIREDRAREAGRLFSEGDWQAMLDVEGASSAPRKRDRFKEKFLAFKSKAHQNVLALASHQAMVFSMIIRNTAWCAIFLWCLTTLYRRNHLESWNYDKISRIFWYLESAFQWQLSIDYVIGLLAATEKLKFVFSWMSLVDIVSLPAMQVIIEAFSGRSFAYYTIYFGAVRYFRLFRMERQIASVFPWIEPVRLIILGLAVDTTVIVLSFACSMWVVEGPQYEKTFLNVSDYVYYSIVTMTTVGYGDYSPATRGARWLTSCAILAGFVILPYHVQRLLSALHIPPVVVGHMPSVSSDFIFIYGKIRPRQLGCMVHEVCEALPGSVHHILVVTPFPASSFKELTQNILRQYRLHVCVSQKCPTSEEMQTYCALARAVFVIADPKPQPLTERGVGVDVGTYPSLLAEDQKAFLRVTKVQPWCWPNVPIAVQLTHGAYTGLAMETGAYHVVPLEWLKLRAIAKSVGGCPGFIPLVFNMYHTPSKESLVAHFFETIEARKDALELALIRQQKSQVGFAERLRRRRNRGAKTPSSQAQKPIKHKVAIRVDISAEDTHNHDDNHLPSLSDTDSDTDESNEEGDAKSTRTFWSGWRSDNSHARRHSNQQRRLLEDRTIRDELNFFYYFRGLKYQVYRLEFPQCMEGLDYSLAVRLLYRRFGVFLIGLVSIDKRFVTSPIGYVIGAERQGPSPTTFPLAGVVLAPSLNEVNIVSKLKVFHVSNVTQETEKKYLSRNLRSKEDLQRAALSYLEDLAKTKPSEPSLAVEATRKRLITRDTHRPSIPSTYEAPRLSVPSNCDSDHSTKPIDEPVLIEVTSAVEAFDLAAGTKPFILCCGWPKDLYQFLSAIEINRPSYVLILAAQDAPSYARWNHELLPFRETCAWFHGSALSIEDLKNAGALLAESIVILASRHAFPGAEDDEVTKLTTIDNETVLVRQQVFALFSRINEYLGHWSKQVMPEDGGAVESPVEKQETVKVKVPLIITELQDKESVEYLSSPKDVFLLSAFRNLRSSKRILEAPGQSILSKLVGHDYSDDAIWAAEGGRRADEGTGLHFNATHTPIDSSLYTMQSEFRSGQLYIRELGYSFLAFCLPVSRFAIDTTFIEHLVDGSHQPMAEIVNKRARENPQLQRYTARSALNLIPIPKMFVGAPFKDVFSYLMKMELKLPIAVMRKIDSPVGAVASPIEALRGREAQELVISCPSPSMPLMVGDRLYVLTACPKHVTGLFFLEKSHSNMVF
eukprot:Blabericola_migrator_1__5033@NODE_260_length_10712_cov_94_884922_g218_i0_p1_GENE_NODE_260_length_10712_cov_94_884922_g218_i0NODE_260_length_10712_cov_94_884922_g218_i0_p1_ORF_typecomplete_len1594_score299_67BK_channel_a/PF03493_18/5_1e11BK_channel_a/PF03493_18/5_9e02Ion_trans_2/PF07885_16/8_6e03Ion_trans_2/PF07885_16/5_3e03Ion_trans_2/PF07885_16/2_8e12Ion_trans/PF00520_31/2e03Ion_trans/PF00520_31/6e09DUF1345/PF07077_11/4_5e03DUF1345/PF07077_11/0_0031IRK/PF01007_20/5_9e03IRK/PF01007_20/0_013DUF17